MAISNRNTWLPFSVVLIAVCSAATAQQSDFDLRELNKLKPPKKAEPSKIKTPTSQTTSGGEDIGERREISKLSQLISKMHLVHERMLKLRLGSTTQQLERQIARELMEMTKGSKRQIRSGAKSAVENGAKQATKQKKNKKQAGKPQTGQGANRGGTAAGSRRREVSAEIERRNEMIGKVWGLLPKRIRSRMRSIPDGQYAAGYIDLVEDYFRRLTRD